MSQACEMSQASEMSQLITKLAREDMRIVEQNDVFKNCLKNSILSK